MKLKSHAVCEKPLHWTPKSPSATNGQRKVSKSSEFRPPKDGLTRMSRSKSKCSRTDSLGMRSAKLSLINEAKMTLTPKTSVLYVDDGRTAKSNASEGKTSKRTQLHTSRGVARRTVTAEADLSTMAVKTTTRDSTTSPASNFKVPNTHSSGVASTSHHRSKIRQTPVTSAPKAESDSFGTGAAKMTAASYARLNSAVCRNGMRKVSVKADFKNDSDSIVPSAEVTSESSVLDRRSSLDKTGLSNTAAVSSSCTRVSNVEVHACYKGFPSSPSTQFSYLNFNSAGVEGQRESALAYDDCRERCMPTDCQNVPQNVDKECGLKSERHCEQSTFCSSVISNKQNLEPEHSSCAPRTQRGKDPWSSAKQRVGFIARRTQCPNNRRRFLAASSAPFESSGENLYPSDMVTCSSKSPSIKKSVTFSPSQDTPVSLEDTDCDLQQPFVPRNPSTVDRVTETSSTSRRRSDAGDRHRTRRSACSASNPDPTPRVVSSGNPTSSRSRSSLTTHGAKCVAAITASSPVITRTTIHSAPAVSPTVPKPPFHHSVSGSACDSREVHPAVLASAGSGCVPGPSLDRSGSVSVVPSPASSDSMRVSSIISVTSSRARSVDDAHSPAQVRASPASLIASSRVSPSSTSTTCARAGRASREAQTSSVTPGRSRNASSSSYVSAASVTSTSAPRTKWKDLAEVMRRIRQDPQRVFEADGELRGGDSVDGVPRDSPDRFVKVVLKNVCYQLPLRPDLPERQEHLFDVSDLQHEPPLISKCGSLEVTFTYQAVRGKMTVHVHRAREIPTKDRGGANSTQVRLMLLPTKKQRFKTKVKEGEEPVFDESFVFNKIFTDEIPGLGVRFRLYGLERMRREYMIGESVIGFASLNLVEPTTHWVILEPRSNLSHGDSGFDVSSLSRSDSASSVQSLQHGGMPELLVGLAYHGTTGRLAVQVVKGSNFRNMATNRPPDTYVKVTLMSPSGQEVQTCKTSIRRGQPNPLFKETFMMQVPQFQLHEVTLMVSVYNKKSMKKKEMIGWFSLGQNSSGEEETCHWADMTDSKGDEVCRWHVLLES